ncbi:hypothetical protein [Flavobacterium reichenbachii]|uniref:Lipoprotein n=1 Tax=Flavobacterium reichenbachii TaxID=362418 RepID=A0A085ZM06_9FLAO|nr:hypothetical protein [Flavobacterium reichenbachii]KFF05470.1 hypothetical protein IW19_08040 [Flavobacterium reichenbachii]OXB17810.1 hypothetical protein B0A68_02380 [Flavobacterium reichenbachii]
MSKFKIILVFFILTLTFSCKKNYENKDRFSYYEPISTKEEIIEIMYIKWAATDRPKFIKKENYNAKNDDSLIEDCFYLDTKDSRIQKISGKDRQNLHDGKTISLSGKFYRTKRFDDFFSV